MTWKFQAQMGLFDHMTSGVVVPGEVGILLIYAPIFFLNGPAKDETVTCKTSLAYLVHYYNICTLSLNFRCLSNDHYENNIIQRGADFAINN